MHAPAPKLGVVAHTESATTRRLVRACNRIGIDASVLSPQRALADLCPGDIALGRLDVRQSLDGIESGLWELRVLEREGVTVLNHAAALGAAHDKLATAARLTELGVPPATVHVDSADRLPALAVPLVLKPRFGSWGHDVVLCEEEGDFTAALRSIEAVVRRHRRGRAGARTAAGP